MPVYIVKDFSGYYFGCFLTHAVAVQAIKSRYPKKAEVEVRQHDGYAAVQIDYLGRTYLFEVHEVIPGTEPQLVE